MLKNGHSLSSLFELSNEGFTTSSQGYQLTVVTRVVQPEKTYNLTSKRNQFIFVVFENYLLSLVSCYSGAMTQLMQKVIKRLSEVPEEKQDETAATLLEALDDDARWDTLFSETTEEQWHKMAEAERADIKADDLVWRIDLLKSIL